MDVRHKDIIESESSELIGVCRCRKSRRVRQSNGLYPTTPTDADPGSEDKVAVLAMRYEREEELWHKDDKTSQTSAYAKFAESRECGFGDFEPDDDEEEVDDFGGDDDGEWE